MKAHLAMLLGAVVLSATAVTVNAWQRHVVVNGYVLNAAALSMLDQAACITVPNGYYWLLQNGVWDYQGNAAPQGYLGEECINHSTPRRTQGKGCIPILHGVI